MSRVIRLMGAIALSSAAAFAQLPNPQLRFHTNQGDIDVTLTYDITPKTVINFLNYLNKGAYTNTIFHRSVASFVVQTVAATTHKHTPITHVVNLMLLLESTIFDRLPHGQNSTNCTPHKFPRQAPRLRRYEDWPIY